MPFHLFPILPPEIRRLIWIASLPGPRHMGPVLSVPRHRLRKRRGPCHEDPVALKICRESRAIALEYYTRRDATHLKSWEVRDDVKYPSYVDFGVDIAFFYRLDLFSNGTERHFLSQEETRKIQRLWIVHDGVVNLGRDLARWMDRWLPLFNGLKEVMVEVRGLRKCRGIAAGGGAFWTVEEVLRGVREMGLERLYRLQDRRAVEGVSCDLPVLEVEREENLEGCRWVGR